MTKELADMTAQRDHWLEIAREKDAEIERLQAENRTLRNAAVNLHEKAYPALEPGVSLPPMPLSGVLEAVIISGQRYDIQCDSNGVAQFHSEPQGFKWAEPSERCPNCWTDRGPSEWCQDSFHQPAEPASQVPIISDASDYWLPTSGQTYAQWGPEVLVDALQDVVHTDPGPVRVGHAVREASSDPNPLDPENHYFRKCLKGHVSYAVSFGGCPSCKVERERDAVKSTV